MNGEAGTLFGLYVHWPFCLSKCPYCDFNSHVHATIDHTAWREALVREIKHYAAQTPGRRLTSIFFGGGTPSLMHPDTVAAIIDTAQSAWTFSNDIEITLEANPTSVEADKFRAFRQAGINRVSLGIQSLREKDLKFLGRTHSVDEARNAIEIASSTFDRFSFDLIYARPQQTVQEWREELNEALQMANGHLSLYQLTIEPGTAFHTWHARGDFQIPEDQAAGEMYEVTQDILAAAGLPSYEISNHARPGEESRHNMTYWRYGDYAGVGPGAHGRLTLDGQKIATVAHRAPEIWLNKVREQGHGAHPVESVTHEQRFAEALMMGLRLAEGVPFDRLEEQSGGTRETFFPPAKIKSLTDEGYLTVTADRITATAAGRQRLNAVLKYLLA
ncbi:MAG: radical superfamily protein [Micavibrio sp.]|nr:radical superfamily protein [Micavibrio sp.]